eukprot:6100320-Pleurochrysis_carterae.AAC.1
MAVRRATTGTGGNDARSPQRERFHVCMPTSGHAQAWILCLCRAHADMRVQARGHVRTCACVCACACANVRMRMNI